MLQDQALHDFVANNPGQGTFEEYRYLADLFAEHAPCNLLIFGVGKDSRMWVELNAGGRTAFVEHEAEWIAMTRQQIPGVEVHQVVYSTKRTQWKKLIDKPDALWMTDLPKTVVDTPWDIIFVDSPQGGSDKRPGRMKSIYTAAKIARPGSEMLLHDCDREIERVYSDAFVGARQVRFTQVRTLRHYHIPE